MTALDDVFREVIREEIRRLIRPEAIAESEEISVDDLELRQRAQDVANRFRRARSG